MLDRKPFFLPLASIGLACCSLVFAVNACGDDASGTGGSGNQPTGTTTTNAGGNGGGTAGGGGATGGGGQGGGGTIVCDPPEGVIPPLQLTQVASGLQFPLFVTSEPQNANRLYIVERLGTIQLVENGGPPQEFLDISALVSSSLDQGDERGLLGLAFHPDYAQNGRFFLYYVPDEPDPSLAGLRIAEFSRSQADPNTADPTPTNILITIDDTPQTELFGNHNGGMLAFGPDGFLYAGVGDGGSAGDPNNNGQNINIKLGKILRLDVDNYPTPPPGNLPGGDPDIWDFGLRNPWRFSFDRCNGDLYIGDVGQNSREEIDIEPAGQGNRNYGWSVMEGTSCFKPNQPPGCDDPSLVPPVVEHPHGAGECSINGGYVYRGNAIPGLRGTYIYGDYCSNAVHTLVWQDGVLMSQGELGPDLESTGVLSDMSSLGEDANGEIYVVDLTGGTIYRIEPE